MTAHAGRAIAEHLRKKALAAKKKAGVRPNVVFIRISGDACPELVEDFASDSGLGEVFLHCSRVSVWEWRDGIGYYYDARTEDKGVNYLASDLFEATLSGDVVICGYENGCCAPLPEDKVEWITRMIKLMKKAGGY